MPLEETKPASSKSSPAQIVSGLANSAPAQASAAAPANATSASGVFAKPKLTYGHLQRLFMKPAKVYLEPLFPKPAAHPLPTLSTELIEIVQQLDQYAAKTIKNQQPSLYRIGEYYLTFMASITSLSKWKSTADSVDQKKPLTKAGLLIQRSIVQGEQLLERFFLRVKWFYDLSVDSRQPFNPEYCLLVLIFDRSWVNDVSKYMFNFHKDTNFLKQQYHNLFPFSDKESKSLQFGL